MTLGEKLEELGYHRSPIIDELYTKTYFDLQIKVVIELTLTKDKIYDYGIRDINLWEKQKDLDHKQIAFNRLKSDIKEIKKWQKLVAKYSK